MQLVFGKFYYRFLHSAFRLRSKWRQGFAPTRFTARACVIRRLELRLALENQLIKVKMSWSAIFAHEIFWHFFIKRLQFIKIFVFLQCRFAIQCRRVILSAITILTNSYKEPRIISVAFFLNQTQLIPTVFLCLYTSFLQQYGNNLIQIKLFLCVGFLYWAKLHNDWNKIF